MSIPGRYLYEGLWGVDSAPGVHILAMGELNKFFKKGDYIARETHAVKYLEKPWYVYIIESFLRVKGYNSRVYGWWLFNLL